MNKKLIILLIILAIAVGVIWAVVFKSDNGPESVADKFFSLIEDNRMQEAYDSYTSEVVKSSIPFVNFQSTMDLLKDHQGLSWDSVTIEGGTAMLQGALTSETGTNLIIEATLILENEHWKVHYVNYRLQPIDNSHLPPEAKLKELVSDSMALFVEAVTEEDFTDLHDEIAGFWRERITADELKESFKQFFPVKDTVAFVEDAEPIIDAGATKIENSILTINGYYESTVKVSFELGYILEDGQWKLININVKVLER